ncbi:ABC transporter substrate-binding protein [Anaerolentibacter hominis]|uniref:ABC transporter substrate-binding protein n=1 Tax=Anaerolentibacter hominis TaxID=3079009 RepID=UPI0031B88D5A
MKKKRNERNYKWIGILLILTLCISVLTGCGAKEEEGGATEPVQGTADGDTQKQDVQKENNADSSDPVKVAFIASVTGTNAAIGEEIVYGAQLACKEINAAGGIGGRELVLEVIDDQLTASEALNAAKKGIDEMGSQVLLGPDPSSNALAVLPYAGEKGVPVLVTGTNYKVTSSGYKNVFRFRANDTATAEVVAEFMVKNEFKNIGLFYTNEDYGLGAYKAVEDSLGKSNIKLSAAETCNIGDTDFTSQIMNLKNADLDALIIFAKETEGAKFLAQAYQLGLNCEKYGGSSLASNFVMELCGEEAVEGVHAIVPYVASNPDAAVQEFVKKYNAEYGIAVPINHAACYYDVVHMLGIVLNEYGTTSEEIIEGFRNIDYTGVQSHYKADENGDMCTKQSISTCKSGVWEFDGYVGD